jgi:hypothetical protein
MLVSEKNFLEKIAAHIPGLAGYREREARRETDRRLREFLAGRIDEGRQSLNRLRQLVMESGALGLMNDVGRLDRALQKASSTLRFADYGYSGLFDQVKIREEELDRIYAFDEALVRDVQEITERLGAAAQADPEAASLADLAGFAEELDGKVVRRKEIFHTPGA